MPTSFSIVADATSAVVSTAAATANGATIVIGGVSPPTNALLRFNTTSAGPAAADTIVSATLTAKISAQGGTPINVDAWAAQFGAAITTSSLNIAANNYGIEVGNTGGFRVMLKTIFSTSAAVSTVATIVIPGLYVNTNSAVNAGFSDFEFRPGTGFVAGSGVSTTIHGAAASGGQAPTLNVITLTNAELQAQNNYREQAVGVETYVGFAQETTAGTPVKANVLLDVRSSTFDAQAVNIASQSLSRQRAKPRKIAVGRSGAGGEVTFELTPEKWVQLLPALLFKSSTTGSGTYTHTFGVATSAQVATYTFVEKVGNFRKVYPGSMVDSLTISANLDAVVLGAMACQARDEWVYDDNSAGVGDEYILSGTASYDTVNNSILSYIGGQATLDGTVDRGLIQSCNIAFKQTIQERRGLSRQRSVTSHFPLGFEVSVNFSMYFENEYQMRKFLGVNHQDFPFKAEKAIQFQQVQFDFSGPLGTAAQNISILLPKMLFETIRTPVNGEGGIMLEASGVAAFDDISTLSNVVVTVVNSEPGSVYAPSTNTITVQPRPVI